MSVSKVLERWPFKAAESFYGDNQASTGYGTQTAAKNFRFVSVSSGGEITLATSGAEFAVVLEDTPRLGEYGTCVVAGVIKVLAGGAITAGNRVAPDNEGRAQKAITNQYVQGVALTSTTGAGQYVTILVHPGVGVKL